MKNEAKILFLGKKNDVHTSRALDFVHQNFEHVRYYLGNFGDHWPDEMQWVEYDYIISYLCPWVIPASMIGHAKLAINFHPAPPEYPGIGCFNFSLYDQSSVYGVTCHFMSSSVDTGAIIDVRRFQLYSSDTVASLIARTYDHQLTLFYEVIDTLISGLVLFSDPHLKWARQPYTRKELNALAPLNLYSGIDEAEADRRIRATTFGKWKPTIELWGYTFELKVEDE